MVEKPETLTDEELAGILEGVVISGQCGFIRTVEQWQGRVDVAILEAARRLRARREEGGDDG